MLTKFATHTHTSTIVEKCTQMHHLVGCLLCTFIRLLLLLLQLLLCLSLSLSFPLALLLARALSLSLCRCLSLPAHAPPFPHFVFPFFAEQLAFSALGSTSPLSSSSPFDPFPLPHVRECDENAFFAASFHRICHSTQKVHR